MSHAEKADRLLIKPAAGARPASPRRSDGSDLRHAERPVTSRVTSGTANTGWRRPQTDRLAESHSPINRSLGQPPFGDSPCRFGASQVPARVAGEAGDEPPRPAGEGHHDHALIAVALDVRRLDEHLPPIMREAL